MKNGPSSARDWLLTVPAFSVSFDQLQEALKPYRWIGQKERGTQSTEKNAQGYEHYQIAIINDAPIRFETLKHKLPKAHIEPRKAERKDLYAYASKIQTRIDGPWTNGDWSNLDVLLTNAQGKRSDLLELRDAIADGATEEDLMWGDLSAVYGRAITFARTLIASQVKKKSLKRDDVDVVWLYGAPGIGKTTRIFDSYPLDDLYRVTDYDAPWDLYAGQPVVVLEDFSGQIRYSVLLSLMEKYPLQLHARYANTWSALSTLYILSNDRPSDLYPTIKGQRREALYRRLFVLTDIQNPIFDRDIDSSELVQPCVLFERRDGSFEEWLREYDPACFR